jgi:hypothetical protein
MGALRLCSANRGAGICLLVGEQELLDGNGVDSEGPLEGTCMGALSIYRFLLASIICAADTNVDMKADLAMYMCKLGGRGRFLPPTT